MLVYPPVVNSRSTNNICGVPMGISYLGAYLRREGYEVKLLDAAVEGYFHEEVISPWLIRFGLPYEDIADRIVDYKPDVLGVSCIFSGQMPGVRRIAHDAKKNLGDDIFTITGGSHPTFMARQVLEEEALDFVVRGEGEQVLTNLLAAIRESRSLSDIRGIAFRNGEKIIVNPKENRIEDLDSLPWPARDLLPMEKYFKINIPMQSVSKRTPNTNITTSRGCPYRCTFCTSSRHWGRFATRSPEDVLDEIDYLIKTYGIKELKFEDDNLTFDTDRAKAIFQGIVDRGYDLAWNTPNGIAIRTLTEDMLKLMKRSGCFEVTLAVESGDPEVLRNVIKKPLDLAETELVARWCTKLGIETTGYFIIGFPGETREQIFRTFRYARRLKLDKAYFFIYNPLVGTPLREKCIRDKLIPEDHTNEDDNWFIGQIESDHWTSKELYRWQKAAFWGYNFSLFLRNPFRFVAKYWNVLTRNPTFVKQALRSLINDTLRVIKTLYPEKMEEEG